MTSRQSPLTPTLTHYSKMCREHVAYSLHELKRLNTDLKNQIEDTQHEMKRMSKVADEALSSNQHLHKKMNSMLEYVNDVRY